MFGKRSPLVSSLQANLRKKMQDDPIEAKKEHRNQLHELMNQYAEDVKQGKATGIRNAKELIDVMKMDLLLLGEVTERTEVSETESDKRIRDIAKVLKEGRAVSSLAESAEHSLTDLSPEELLAQTVKQMNDYNDEQHR